MAKKPTAEQFREVLSKKFGNLSETAKAFGATRQALYNWIKEDAEFKEIKEDQIETLIDFAESKLMTSINNGSDTATIFFLKTKGRDRGYIEKREIDHTTQGEKINIINLGAGLNPDEATEKTE